MGRKGKSSTLDKPTSPGGFLVWTACCMTITSPLAKLLFGVYESFHSWIKIFFFHREYMKSVFGTGLVCSHGQKNDMVKATSPSSSISLIVSFPSLLFYYFLVFFTSPAMQCLWWKLHFQATQELQDLQWSYSTPRCEEQDWTQRHTCSFCVKFSLHVSNEKVSQKQTCMPAKHFLGWLKSIFSWQDRGYSGAV